MTPRAVACAAVWLAVGVASWGCGKDAPPTIPVVGDTAPPVVQVVFPPADGGLYDRDSNGLLDLEVAWSDVGGRVDPSSVRVLCVDACLPDVPRDTNLARGWRVVRNDSAGFAVEETIGLLLRGGSDSVRLRITVADTAGNVSPPQTVTVIIPPGAYHRSINVGGHPTCQPERGVNLALSADGRKGFAPFHQCVAVFDPDGVQPTRFITGMHHVGWASIIDVDTATGLAYIAGGGTPSSGVTVIDTRSEQIVMEPYTGFGVASVAVDGDRVYAGEACTNGRIFVLNKRTLAVIGRIEVGAVSQDAGCPNVDNVAFSRDHRIGYGGIVYGGILRFNTETLTLLERTGLTGDANQRDILLAQDRYLYRARLQSGLWEWDTQTGVWSNTGREPPLYKELALSPDGLTLAVAAGMSALPAPHGPRLYDVPGMRERFIFPPRYGAISDAIVWHPDGKRLFLMTELNLVEVYLVRPR
jgi:hypothetical protein